ncbi:MAG: SDR family NAD(P)-dependent oxidoreductase [Actinomycetes bacterium]
MGTQTSHQPESLKEAISLEGKTAIVTGGAMGIGRAIAQRLHEAGANVVVSDPNAVRDEVVRQLIEARAESAMATDTDVSDGDAVEAMVARTVKTFGAVDILINNAGIYPSMPMLEMAPEQFRRVVEINLTGLFLCTQAASREMVERGRGGTIVNITSIDALHPSMVGLSHYDASKNGAWGFTKNVALELAPHGIRVNAIAPGGVSTPGVSGMDAAMIAEFESLIPLGRMGDPDEIAMAALFLASDMSTYMTGSQMVVDGGRLLH